MSEEILSTKCEVRLSRTQCDKWIIFALYSWQRFIYVVCSLKVTKYIHIFERITNNHIAIEKEHPLRIMKSCTQFEVYWPFLLRNLTYFRYQ